MAQPIEPTSRRARAAHRVGVAVDRSVGVLAGRHPGAESGSALLLVVGTTAAIGTLAAALLSTSLLAYEIAVLDHQGAQARLLAASALGALAGELAAGRLPAPEASNEIVWTEEVPSAPGRGVPAGCRFEVRLSVLTGPRGQPLYDSSTPPARLIDAVAEGRCGRGLEIREGRFALAVDGSVTRLY